MKPSQFSVHIPNKRSLFRYAKMKLFESLQSYYAALDIFPTQSDKRSSFNFHNLFIPLNFSVLFIFQIGFFLFKAKDIVEHAETFYSSLTILGCNAIFVTKFWQMPNILKLIANFEKFIEKSEWRKNETFRMYFQKCVKFQQDCRIQNQKPCTSKWMKKSSTDPKWFISFWRNSHLLDFYCRVC